MSITEAGSVAVAIFVWSPQGIPLVMDPAKPEPRFWKLPGGRGESAEDKDVIDAAIRELREETGILVSRGDIQSVSAEARKDHTITFFVSFVKNLEDHVLKDRGDGGELVRIFTHKEFGSLLAGLHSDGDFFEPHREVLWSRETQRIIMRFLDTRS